jgi:hypothetical protein
MAVTYIKPYPGGWQDLPTTTTPIMAYTLDGIDQGIVDAQAAAAAAQTTADNALAAGGDGIFIVSGVALDGVTDDGPAIQAALEAVEDGTRGASLLVHGDAGKVCYVNSTITISRSGTKLASDVEFLFGPLAKIRPWGVIDEQPVIAASKPELTVDAASGAHTVTVNAIPTDWGVGDYLGLRGNRSAAGAVLSNQIFHSYVTALDRTAKTITFQDGLNAAYKVTNTTTWSNKKSQLTKVTQATLTGTPDAGEVTVAVNDSTVFTVGQVVQVTDDTHTLDGDGTVQDGNFAHKEQAIIAEIPNGTSVKLSHALYHSYDTSQNARIQVLDVLEDVELRDLTIRFAAQMDDGEHAIEVRYAHNTHLKNIHIVGGNDSGYSWDGHAVRFTDSLACSLSTGVISNPSNVAAGRGYGVSFYGSTLCWVQDFAITGCRHSVLWFNGASGCNAINVISTDARISDFDWHGADCVGNRTSSCTAVGGTRTTPDGGGNRSAWKWGNPSHRPGDTGNYASDCLVVGYAGAAIECIPTSGDDVWQGVVRGADIGVKLVPLTDDGTQVSSGMVVRDSEFYDVATPLQVDGGSSAIVRKLVVDNNRWHRSGNFTIANAPGVRFTRNTVLDPAGTGYILSLDNCDGALVKGNDFTGADRGIQVTNSTGFRATGNDFHDLTGSTVVLRDGGGNTGYLWRDNDYIGYTPTASYAGTPSAGTLELTRTTGGGGGGGTYPPAGGVPYADLDSSLQGLVSGAYQLPGTGIPETDLATAVQTSLGKADTAYQFPVGGIPNSDLATPGGGTGYAADTPAGHGYDEWSFDPAIAQSSAAATAGRLEMVRVRVTSSGTSTGLVFSVATAASGLTAAYGIVYDAAGNQIAITGDISSSLTSTGVKSIATGANYSRTAAQDLYLAVLQVGGTPAALHRAVTSAGLGNAGLNAAAGYRFMSYGSGLTSAPSTITVSSGTSSANTYWMAVR